MDILQNLTDIALYTTLKKAMDKGKVYWGEYRIVNATYINDKKAICSGFSM
jgi:hypothetical protein